MDVTLHTCMHLYVFVMCGCISFRIVVCVVQEVIMDVTSLTCMRSFLWFMCMILYSCVFAVLYLHLYVGVICGSFFYCLGIMLMLL